jgi:hypothetical protein
VVCVGSVIEDTLEGGVYNLCVNTGAVTFFHVLKRLYLDPGPWCSVGCFASTLQLHLPKRLPGFCGPMAQRPLDQTKCKSNGNR